jgi:hypothetical protein
MAKLRRAIHHYRTLKNIHWGVDHRLRPVVATPSADGLSATFRVGEIEDLNPDIPLILGDAFHNLRAALDLLVFQLHVRHYRGKVPHDAVEASAFPIIMDERLYTKGAKKGTPKPTATWGSIRRLAKAERTAIEWLQPYKGFNEKWPRPDTQIGQLRAGLKDIHDFDIIDKHRQPHLVTAILFSVAQPRFPGEDYGFRQPPAFPPPGAPRSPLESGALADTWTFDRPPPPEYFSLHPGVTTGIGMEPAAGDWVDVLPNLGGSIWVVAIVIRRFARLFPALKTPPITISDIPMGDIQLTEGPGTD